MAECQICIEWEHPCKKCRKEIHRSWHKQGLFWIRSEECDYLCLGFWKFLPRRVMEWLR